MLHVVLVGFCLAGFLFGENFVWGVFLSRSGGEGDRLSGDFKDQGPIGYVLLKVLLYNTYCSGVDQNFIKISR